MKRSDYQAMQRELTQTRNEAVAEADAKYNEAVEALEHLWSIVGGGEAAPAKRGPKPGRKRGPGRPRKARATARKTTAKTPARRGRKPGARGTLIDSMRTAVTKQSGSFSITEVKDSLGQQGVSLKNVNPAVLSTTMKRLETLGEIKLVRRGKGRRASVYKKS